MTIALDLLVVAASIAMAILVFSITVESMAKIYESRASDWQFFWGMLWRMLGNALASTVAVVMAVGTWFV